MSVFTVGVSVSSTNSLQFGGRLGGDDAATRVDQRPLGFLDHLRGAADLAGVALGEDFVARQVDRSDRLIMSLALEHVLGDVHQHRPGPPGRSHIEGFVDGLREIFQALHQVVVLGAGAGDAEGVGLLERIAADEFGGDLAGDGDDRNGVHHGVHQAGGEVGGAGPGGGAADTDFAGRPGIAFRGEGRVLFMAHQYVADVVLVEHVVERQGDAARIPEHAVDAFPHQTFQQHFCAAHQR